MYILIFVYSESKKHLDCLPGTVDKCFRLFMSPDITDGATPKTEVFASEMPETL